MEKHNELTRDELVAVISLLAAGRRMHVNVEDRTTLNAAQFKLTREYMKMDVRDSRDNERGEWMI